MLDSALSNYGDSADHGAEQGLAERILARVSSEENPYRSAPRWRSRFLCGLLFRQRLVCC